MQREAGALAHTAQRRVEAEHPWYRDLPADVRAWIGLVAQAGIADFVSWLHLDQPEQRAAAEVFGTAPRELTSAISLKQTLDLVRSVVGTVEEEVDRVVSDRTERARLREAVLRYSREIAFGAAEVYARAAESRGKWDARLEALVVDAVLRGEADDSMQSRATALGWGSVSHVTVVAGQTPSGSADFVVDAFRRTAERLGVVALAAVQGRRLVIIVGGSTAPLDVVTKLADDFGAGPIVVGPTVPHLFAAGRSARAALNGLSAATAWPQAPRPVHADELLPERILVGDTRARRVLVERIAGPLVANPALAHTCAVYLDTGGLEATARELFVHSNTVRYRLGRISELTGYDVTSPRDAYAVRLALALERLSRPAPAGWRQAPDGGEP